MMRETVLTKFFVSKKKITVYKPIYLGFMFLELSKLDMYENLKIIIIYYKPKKFETT